MHDILTERLTEGSLNDSRTTHARNKGTGERGVRNKGFANHPWVVTDGRPHRTPPAAVAGRPAMDEKRWGGE